ncbi:MAG: hypothetical protein HC889_11425 [Synechococcaceae cyanobacterium SM1_2_3]|nr:hypothetical protein [Synechococcaceae cyanobacterium SM1_2_3]
MTYLELPHLFSAIDAAPKTVVAPGVMTDAEGQAMISRSLSFSQLLQAAGISGSAGAQMIGVRDCQPLNGWRLIPCWWTPARASHAGGGARVSRSS